MSKEWSLKELYTSYDSKAYKEDKANLIANYDTLSRLTLEDNLECIQHIISILESNRELIGKLFAFSNLQLSTDTTQEASLTAIASLRQLLASHAKTSARINKFLGEITTDITVDPYLSQYAFKFQELKEDAAHILSEEVEEVISMLNLSAGQSWEQLQKFLTSTIEGEFQGNKITLSEIRNLAYSDDADIRKAAYNTELEMYQTIKEPVAFALNNIKSQVNDVTTLRGYASPLDATLENSRMSRSTLDALIGAIEDALPQFHRYLKHKATLLGHENGLPFYDLFAPIGEAANRQFTVEEARDYLVEHFSHFSTDLSDMVTEFFDKQYIDMYPKKGKVGGAFCANLPFIKQSRILMNFDGGLRNVVTMAHELGHAYHGMHIQDHLPLNRSYTMPVAETASTFNENLIMNKVISEASDAEKISLLESQIQDTTQIIVDIYSRYLFETAVFDARKEKFLFSKDLEALMLDAQEKAYGSGLDATTRHPYMWLCKGHYYSAGLSFYNFPYAFGGLFSKGLYVNYLNEPTGFVEKYQAMLRATTISTVEDTAKTMGIDLTTKDFWKSALDAYSQEIDQFIELTSK